VDTLYLVQHGKAFDEKVDPERKLTPEGVAETTLVASYLAGVRVSVNGVVHSGKARALQTAEIFAKYLNARFIKAIDGLNPNDDPGIIAGKLGELGDGVMIVGHLPHLSKLVSLLVVGNSSIQVVNFRYSGVLKLRYLGGGWVIDWYITPELVKR
jgi:phosphohistidine phosphatase